MSGAGSRLPKRSASLIKLVIQLSRLLRAVERGQRFTISVRGKPVADLIPHRGDATEAVTSTPDVVVIDASMALAWLFEREQPSDRERANRLLAACGEAPWWIPGLWHLEVSNALLVAERRSVLPQTDSDSVADRSSRILALARSHGLSSYDAAYLELAQRRGAAPAGPGSQPLPCATGKRWPQKSAGGCTR